MRTVSVCPAHHAVEQGLDVIYEVTVAIEWAIYAALEEWLT